MADLSVDTGSQELADALEQALRCHLMFSADCPDAGRLAANAGYPYSTDERLNRARTLCDEWQRCGGCAMAPSVRVTGVVIYEEPLVESSGVECFFELE